MRAASLLASGEQDSEECRRLIRRIGMETEETEREKSNGE